MSLHDVPICFGCAKQVTHDLVFAAICDHEECPSAVWHPLCLMDFRENRERRRQELGRFLARHEIVVMAIERDEQE